MNLNVREFQNSIVNFINQSEIPIEVKRLVIKDILEQVSQEADRQIRMEIIKREEECNEQGIQQDTVGERAEP